MLYCYKFLIGIFKEKKLANKYVIESAMRFPAEFVYAWYENETFPYQARTNSAENSPISQRAFNLAGFEVKHRARQQIVSGGRF